MDLDKKRRSYGHIREVNPETLQNSRTFEVSNTHHSHCNILEVQELVSKQQKNEPQSPLIKNQSVSPHPSINKKDRALSDFNANIERSRSQAAVQSQIVSQGYNKLTPAEKSKYRHENEKPNWEDDNRVKPFSNEESDVFFFQSVTNSRESSIARDSSSNFFSKQASPSHEVDSHRMKSNRSNSGDFYASKKSLPKNQRNLAMQQIDERNISKEVSSPTEANMSHNSNHYGTVSFAKYLTNPSQPSQHDQGVEVKNLNLTKF